MIAKILTIEQIRYPRAVFVMDLMNPAGVFAPVDPVSGHAMPPLGSSKSLLWLRYAVSWAMLSQLDIGDFARVTDG